MKSYCWRKLWINYLIRFYFICFFTNSVMISFNICLIILNSHWHAIGNKFLRKRMPGSQYSWYFLSRPLNLIDSQELYLHSHFSTVHYFNPLNLSRQVKTSILDNTGNHWPHLFCRVNLQKLLDLQCKLFRCKSLFVQLFLKFPQRSSQTSMT